MASILAIISKSVFDKTAPKDVVEGSVLPLDRYTSNSKALADLADGGALFLVTVRPPDETLWLVAVLEDPVAKDGAWVAAKNQVPVTRINTLLPKLRLENKKGIAPKPGAMGMSLQTPRVLAAEDVVLLRGAAASAGKGKGETRLVRDMGEVVKAEQHKPSTASEAYASVMDGYRKAPGTVPEGPLEFRNHLHLFAMDRKEWPKHVERQLASVMSSDRKAREKAIAEAMAGGELSELEVVDVVDKASDEVRYQFYLFNYGSGIIFEHATTTAIGGVCQHGVEIDSDDVDPDELLKSLESAYYSFPGKLGQFVEFEGDDDEE